MSAPEAAEVFAQLPILGEIGDELDRIMAAEASPAVAARSSRWRRPRSLRVVVLVSVLVLGLAAAALAASGVITTGSPVKPTRPPVATAGVGIPEVGGSRLLALRVMDPGGGPRWGMRIVHTTRDELCVQVGRVVGGRLGQLGADGAFGDDGRFHPLPADVLPDDAGPAGSLFEQCRAPGQTYAGFSDGVEASAAGIASPGRGVAADARVLSFGLLGRYAVSVAYGRGAGRRSVPVIPGIGAYLIVQRPSAAAGTEQSTGSGASNGDELPYPQTDPAAPAGALRSITYRFGTRTCVDDAVVGLQGLQSVAAINEANARIVRFRRACGLSEGPPTKPPALPSVREALAVHLTTRGRRVTAATLRFPSPIAITHASQSYSASVIVGHHETGLVSTNTNYKRGAPVSLTVTWLLAQAATRTVRIEVDYYNNVPGRVDQYGIVGTTTVALPAGTRPPLLPPALPQSHAGTRSELLRLRAPDPAGGPPWGIRLVLGHGGLAPTSVAPQIGRIADGRIGILGRDDSFDNDGRFHPDTVDLASPVQYPTGGTPTDPSFATLTRFAIVLPGVASANDGCGSGVSIEFASCPTHDLRTLVAGFAGPGARSVTISGNGIHTSAATADGFYLAVLDLRWNRTLTFTATARCAAGTTSTATVAAHGAVTIGPYCRAA
jgi:hypothetical protein